MSGVLGNGAAIAAVVLFGGGAGQALGHQDPRGDIHPQVSVMDGMFAIDFNTSQPEPNNDFTDSKPIQRVIYTAEGKLFAPRHSLDGKRPRIESGPVGLYGRRMRLGDSTVIFQEDRSGRPGYLLESLAGALTRVRLPWPEKDSLGMLEETLVVPEGIAMTAKEGGWTTDSGGPLKFYWFAHESTAAAVVLTIGATACIYNFPVASNIAFAGGRFWVGYMRPTGGGGLKLALWSWKPGDHDGRVEDLDSPADGNSHLSLAAIGDRLCLAYHCVKNPDGPWTARIVTVFRKAE